MEKVSWFDWEEWQHTRIALAAGLVPAIPYFLFEMVSNLANASYWSSTLEEATLGGLAILVVVYISYELVKETAKFALIPDDREAFNTALALGLCLAPILWFLSKFFSWLEMHSPAEGTDVLIMLLWVSLALTLGVFHGRKKRAGNTMLVFLAYGLGSESILMVFVTLSNPQHGLYLKMVFGIIAALGWAVASAFSSYITIAVKRKT